MLGMCFIYVSFLFQGVLHLQTFVKWLLNLMTKEQMRSLIVLNSLVVAVQKAIDNFAGFLNPHFHRLVSL
jgi:hypothetical protein